MPLVSNDPISEFLNLYGETMDAETAAAIAALASRVGALETAVAAIVDEGLSFTSTGAMAAYVVVKKVSNTEIAVCDPTQVSDAGLAFAVTTSSVSALGGSVTVQDENEINNPLWTWTPDEPVYVTHSGVLTQTADLTLAYTQVIGMAVSSTRLSLRFYTPIVL